MDKKKEKVVCSDCKGIMYVGGAERYSCFVEDSAWSKLSSEERRKSVEERVPIVCAKFDLVMAKKMKELEARIKRVEETQQIEQKMRKDFLVQISSTIPEKHFVQIIKQLKAEHPSREQLEKMFAVILEITSPEIHDVLRDAMKS